MAECRDCEDQIRWCEIETKNGVKKIPIDLQPSDAGEFVLQNRHSDLPLLAIPLEGPPARREELLRRFGPAKYTTHRKTCPERDPSNDHKERDPNWVREPEGY